MQKIDELLNGQKKILDSQEVIIHAECAEIAERQANEDAAKDRHRESEDAMLQRHRESEDNLRSEHRATEDAACERHRETKDDTTVSVSRLTTLAVKVGTLCTAAVLLTLLWTWHIGRPAEVALGLVPFDTVSGKQMQEKLRVATAKVTRLEGENARLNDEGNRTAEEVARLRLKNSWNSETRNALQGFVSGDTNILERVLTQNPYRNHDFPWTDWNPAIAEKCVRMAIDANKMTPLFWMTQQPKWASILSLDTVNEVKAILNPEQKTLPRYSSNRSQSHWRRSIIAERDSLKRENARLQSGQLAKDAKHKNANLFMFALFWDNDEDFKKVRLDDLPHRWHGDYQRVIERLKELGSTKVLPLLDIDRALKREEPLAQDHPLGGSQ